MTILHRIRGFFITLGQSCYNMELYRRVRTRPWTHAVVYAVIFFALLSLLLTLATVPGSFRLLGEFRAGINDQVPDGAEFALKDGQFSSTLPPGTEFGDDEFVFVVDGGVYGKEFPKSFDDRVGVTVGRDAVFVQEEDGSREIMPLEGAPDVSISKESVLDWIGSYGNLLITGLLFMFLGLHYSLSLLGALFYIVITAALTFLISRLWKVRLTFLQWFAVGLHAITLPTLIDYLFGFIGLDVPFAFTVIYFMFMFSVIADERARPVKKARKHDSVTAGQDPYQTSGE